MTNSFDMAIDAILWLKEDKRCFLHCTEYGYEWRADAIGYNGKDLIEVEVKTSWTDFQADFSNKVKKHDTLLKAYNVGDSTAPRYSYVPNYMYYLVTKEVLGDAKKYLEDNKLPYGLMLWETKTTQHPLSNYKGVITSVKKVKRLHKNPPTQRELNLMMARMSNEYIYGFINMKNRLKCEMNAAVENFFGKTVERSFELTHDAVKELLKETNNES